jgi:hypothetical protein
MDEAPPVASSARRLAGFRASARIGRAYSSSLGRFPRGSDSRYGPHAMPPALSALSRFGVGVFLLCEL